MRATDRPGIARTARSTASTSGVRESAPGFASTARSLKEHHGVLDEDRVGQAGAASTSTVSRAPATSAAQ